MPFSISRPFGVFILCAGTLGAAAPVAAQNLVVDGSLCVGFDCPAAPAFGFDTIRMQENNLRLHFDDTSTAASFPRNDWRIVANDSANGGASYLAIEDSTAGRQVFRVSAAARANALFVDAQGDVGFGTSTPATDLHMTAGDTPTLRLEQNSSSGFAPQTWDVAGNEAGFFVRDVTNGSALPFRIIPGASSNTLVIDDDDDVGIGAGVNPEEALHIERSGGNEAVVLIEAGAADSSFRLEQNGAVPAVWEFRNQAGSGRLNVGIAGGNTPLKIDDGADNNLLKLGDNINSNAVIVTGQIIVNGTPLNVPDYVFEDDYALRPLSEVAAFIADNGHLPGVPSARTINTEQRFNIVDMQLTLLEKVEELTLYTLAQEDMIAGLRAEIDMLKVAD